MTSQYRLAATSVEKIPVFIGADSDPTAAALEFAVTAGPGVTPQPADADWAAGEWVLYTAADGGATALTPLAGDVAGTPPAVIALTAGIWRIWSRVATGTERPINDLGLLDVY